MHKVISRVLSWEKRNLIYFMHNPTKSYVLKMGEQDSKKGKVSNLKQYWFQRYINYIKNYEETLNKNFPKTMLLYRVFRNGTKAFFSDLRRYLSVLKKQNLDGLNNITMEEIQLTYTMPKDLLKISPVILISMLPFTNYVIFPLAYYFPRQLLTYHFWTPDQRVNFMILDHKQRFKYSRTLFHHMKVLSDYVDNTYLKNKWSGIISCLDSGGHPTVESVIFCSNLFATIPYSLEVLEVKHMRALLRIHGLSIWRPFKKQRLRERGMLLRKMDGAIVRDGGVINISEKSLSWALSFRGLNPVNMSVPNMRNWLEKWIMLSSSIDESKLSLLLHGPIILAYNHINNLRIYYK